MKITEIKKSIYTYSVVLRFYNRNILVGESSYSHNSIYSSTFNNLLVLPTYRKLNLGSEIIKITENQILNDNNMKLKEIKLVAHQIDSGGLIKFFEKNNFSIIHDNNSDIPYIRDDGLFTYNLVQMIKYFNR